MPLSENDSPAASVNFCPPALSFLTCAVSWNEIEASRCGTWNSCVDSRSSKSLKFGTSWLVAVPSKSIVLIVSFTSSSRPSDTGVPFSDKPGRITTVAVFRLSSDSRST